MISQDTKFDAVAALNAAIDEWRINHRYSPDEIAALLISNEAMTRIVSVLNWNAHYLGLGTAPLRWENGKVRFASKGEPSQPVQTYKGIPVVVYEPPLETSAVAMLALHPGVLVYPSTVVENAQEGPKQPNLTPLGAKRMNHTSSPENGTSASVMVQQAPYPSTLDYLVSELRYKPGWAFTLMDIDRGQGSKGLTLCIFVSGPDTNDPTRPTNVVHYMPVPAASYNRQSWMEWLLEQILLVERHEALEFFRIEGRQVAPPNHGPGFDPYTVRWLNTQEDAETTFKGEHKLMPF